MHCIIGDIHGNIEELRKLLKLLRPRKSDTLVFLGDYIDKLPHTQETLMLLEKLSKEHDCIFLKGNHDYVWEQYLLHEDLSRQAFLLQYGGRETLRHFGPAAQRALEENDTVSLKKTLHSYIELIEEMEDYSIVEEYLALHAGLLPNQYVQDPLVFEEQNFFLRSDAIRMKEKYLGKYRLVAGHTYLGDEPSMAPGYINIDLGAGYGKYLCVFLVESRLCMRSDGKEFPL